jgi:signal transduction histidine kinase
MSGLINSTLNLAKMENDLNSIKVEREMFDFKKFLSDIIDRNLGLASAKGIKILTRIDNLPNKFNADIKMLDHAFTNVISNAIKYSKINGNVRIIAKSNDRNIAVRIIDQGIGIPKEDLINIGKKFFRAGNTLSIAGTGIGLYITKHFIELHDGNLVIESENNVGSSFTIFLPCN